MIGLQTELAQVTLDDRVHWVSVRAIEKTRPLQGRGEEFAFAGMSATFIMDGVSNFRLCSPIFLLELAAGHGASAKFGESNQKSKHPDDEPEA
ncbi:MAG TPA: hypothetical protein VLL05_06345 [Terriglobales bacterium]|nr:hypothetical protein [Terriglobales bacterium]